MCQKQAETWETTIMVTGADVVVERGDNLRTEKRPP
jgi:hypothetical protein